MKNKNLIIRLSIATLLIIVVSFQGCVWIESLIQPYYAEPNSSFDVEIVVEYDPDKQGKENQNIYFGILLPDGWTVNDSIQFQTTTSPDIGFITYSEALSLEMTFHELPPQGYYWWFGSDTININGVGTFYSTFEIHTNDKVGIFFIDYKIGYPLRTNFIGSYGDRSNDNYIYIGDVPANLIEGITFTSQEEVDNFPVNYPGYTTINGNVTISGEGITALDSLYALNYIGGNLKITDNENLGSLEGLNNLDSIGGTFSLKDNPILENFSGVDNLILIGRDLRITGGASIFSFSGLDNLVNIGRTLMINKRLFNDISFSGLSNLQYINNLSIISASPNDFTGLDNLTSIPGSIRIEKSYLNSFNGLNNIGSVGGNVFLFETYSITNLTGLEGITSIGGGLFIEECNSLNSTQGLENLNSIGGALIIRTNDELSSLSGLEGISAASINSLGIYGNTSLSHCHVQSICDYLAAQNGTIIIQGNAPGCSSPEEVEEACLYLGVGEEENNKTPEFQIYPSPVNDFAILQFQSDQPCTGLIEIFNTTGVRIQNQLLKMDKAGQQHLVLDFTALPAGIYLCRIKVGNEIVSAKIVKQ